MARKQITLLFSLMSLTSFSAMGIEFTRESIQKNVLNKTKVEIKIIDKLHVNAVCDKKKCEAISALTKKYTKAEKESRLYGNPASRHCSELEGQNIILKDNTNAEYDYCEFKDKSLISSWDLYYAHHAKEVVK